MGGLFSSKKAGEVSIDFDKKDESKKHEPFEEVFRDHKAIRQRIEDYKGCRDLVRQAMSNTSQENELAAFEGLLQAVDSIALFFNFCNKLTVVLPDFLVSLSQKPLNEQQGMAIQLAQLFDFALTFDQTRMMRPNLSNDFSYYRRLLPKFSKHPDVRIKDDDASGMALFTAEHIPIISTISKAARQGVADGKSTQIQAMLASMANSCMRMLKNKKFNNPETNLMCARAMTGAIVIFDLLGPQSAFTKTPISIKPCITILKKDFPQEGGLTNAIHYSTRTIRDAHSSIHAMLE